ncbi:hypothetical protein [Candidatus Coxiella mudrowiae]|uniref:hypothetical protein n=1 Tax=Candidatus Coxiella mudrowiae TaxID=2054173 RepID=UPI000AA30766|nr:hypothetical protein [Candidatus Coxiella mudrowiae]
MNDNYFHTPTIDVAVVLIVFEGMSPMQREDRRRSPRTTLFDTTGGIDWAKAIKRVLHYPSVADKSFLITIVLLVIVLWGGLA